MFIYLIDDLYHMKTKIGGKLQVNQHALYHCSSASIKLRTCTCSYREVQNMTVQSIMLMSP